jgi:trypsin-like peptidase
MIRLWRRVLILEFVLALVMFDGGVAAQRAIPDDNLAYPILISVGDGSSGSGFFLNTPDGIYLVTAKHVLFNPKTQALLSPHLDLLGYSKDPSDPTKIRISVDLPILQSIGKLKPHPTQDVVVVELFIVEVQPLLTPPPQPAGSIPTVKPSEASPLRTVHPLLGVNVVSMAKLGLLGVDVANVKTFDHVLTGNGVMVFGYPSSLALENLQQLDASRPLLRKGIVAGTNPEKKSIVLDCPVYYGNSGGPVLEVDSEGFGSRFAIIGVVDQFVPFIQSAGSQTVAMQIASNSGYSIAIPMDFVLELTK